MLDLLSPLVFCFVAIAASDEGKCDDEQGGMMVLLQVATLLSVGMEQKTPCVSAIRAIHTKGTVEGY